MRRTAEEIASVLRAASGRGRPAIVAYLTAGYPSPDRFREDLSRVRAVADVVEIGVPFSDPVADGTTIQRASRQALAHGMTLRRLFDVLRETPCDRGGPMLLMSYLNPILSFGFERVASEAAACHVSGLIVPDLPYEDNAPLRDALDHQGLALVHLVTPATPPERLHTISRASIGFVYAVTIAGVTGGELQETGPLGAYLDRVREVSPVPVVAGFGVRTAEQVRSIGRHADGVVIGSALLEAIERGQDPAGFLASLGAA